MLDMIIFWLHGSCDYFVSDEYADKTAHLLTRSGANFRKLKRRQKGLTFTLPYPESAPFERIMKKHGIEFGLTAEHGARYLMRRYKKRIGIPIGIILFFAVLWLSGRFVWTVEIEGNSTISDEEIINRLDSMSFGVGTYIDPKALTSLHNRFLLKYTDIAWISVNISGTRAVVEVLETETPEAAPDADTPYNLVASEQGVIEYIEVLRGKPTVKEGDLVHKGDLLASGIEEMKHGYRFVHAMGSVMAEVKREVTVKLPLESTELRATGREFSEEYLNIFGISFKISSNTSNMSPDYEKIQYNISKKSERLNVFGAVEVPITRETLVFTEFERCHVTYSEEQARAMAYEKLRLECEAAIGDGELSGREISGGIIDGEYVIKCRLTVLADIAKKQPIYRDK